MGGPESRNRGLLIQAVPPNLAGQTSTQNPREDPKSRSLNGASYKVPVVVVAVVVVAVVVVVVVV